MRQHNVEIKARISDFDEIGNIASEIAGGAPEVLDQVDTYFNVSRGRLKLRQYEGVCELIYYERPDTRSPKHSAYERLTVESAEQLKRILTSAIGIRVVVCKRRFVYIYNDVRIHLDIVEGLGQFLELEAVSREGISMSECRSRVEDLLGKFKVKESDLVEVSYCDLKITKKKQEVYR